MWMRWLDLTHTSHVNHIIHQSLISRVRSLVVRMSVRVKQGAFHTWVERCVNMPLTYSQAAQRCVRVMTGGWMRVAWSQWMDVCVLTSAIDRMMTVVSKRVLLRGLYALKDHSYSHKLNQAITSHRAGRFKVEFNDSPWLSHHVLTRRCIVITGTIDCCQ